MTKGMTWLTSLLKIPGKDGLWELGGVWNFFVNNKKEEKLSSKRSRRLLATPVGPVTEIFRKCSSFQKDDEKTASEDVHVTKGHFVVYVGENRTRYVIPISWLSHPKFQYLLQLAAEEYGFRHASGITIPCDEVIFLSLAASIGEGKKDNCL
ncbi:protein SMALL AUXIN UP-REGULATED RNA 12-like [Silene latifolia]|uniref:protein SMALL AUXIN UP-REGULATED RNA 12-like n=1 Tax=Silene latifolia TaxID=37657 RepID=UPI003D781030